MPVVQRRHAGNLLTNELMTLDELKQKVRICQSSRRGHYKVSIDYRGDVYHCLTTNSIAFDRIKAQHYYMDDKKLCGYTLKEAYQYLWDICKEYNGLRRSRYATY